MERLVQIFSKYFSEFEKENINCQLIQETDDQLRLFFDHNKSGQGNILLKVTESGYVEINPQDPYNIPDYHLANLLYLNHSDFSIDNFSKIFDFIKQTIPSMTDYCVATGQLLEYQSDIYGVIDDPQAHELAEELMVGNPVTEKIQESEDVAKFKFDLAEEARKSSKRDKVFEPFPHYFTRGAKIDRNEMTVLSGKNASESKDWAKLEKTLKGITWEYIKEKAKESTSDQELSKKIGIDLYNYLRFVYRVFTTRLVKDFTLNDSDNRFSAFKIVYPEQKEEQIKEQLGEQNTYLFHGSPLGNWFSIIINGIKLTSDTSLMMNGQVHGKGVYLTDDFAMASNYSGCSGNFSLVGICQVRGKKNDYSKSGNIYVIPNQNYLVIRYLLLVPKKNKMSISRMINDRFNTQSIIKHETSKNNNRAHSARLVSEFKKFQKLDPDQLGICVELPNPNDMTVWNAKLFGFDPETSVAKSMEKLNIPYINLEIVFPNDYPFKPPFIRVLKPRFVYRTGRITLGGSICTETLTSQGWSAVKSMENVLVEIRSLIIEGEGEIDEQRCNQEYSFSEAKEAFNRMKRSYGWD